MSSTRPTTLFSILFLLIAAGAVWYAIDQRGTTRDKIKKLEDDKKRLQLELSNYEAAFYSAIDSADKKSQLTKSLKDVREKNDSIHYNISSDSLVKLWAKRFGTGSDTVD